MNRLHAFFVVVFAAAIGIVGAVAASADSTQLTVTVPSAISMTGLVANYAATIPAGTSGNIDAALTISTNNASGYKLTVTASNPQFGSGGNNMPLSVDTLSIGPTFTAIGPLALAPGVVVKTTAVPTAGAGDTFTVRQSIAVPAGQAAGAYLLFETFVAVANP